VSKFQFSDPSVGEIVANADRQRRWRDGVRLLTRVVPVTAVLVAAVAVLARFAGWPRPIVPALFGLSLVAAGVAAWVARRPRQATASMAGRLDSDASLG